MFVSKRSAGAVTATLLSALFALPEAQAANRAYPGANARALYAPDEANCLSRSFGVLRNACTYEVRVQLPMSADAAAWYYISVYGNRTGSTSVRCTPMSIRYNGTVQVGPVANFVYGDNRAEVMKLAAMPVYGPGDAVYAECVMGGGTSIYSYGWN